MDIDKYLGQGIEIEINGDKLKLPQLGIEYQKYKFKVFRAVSKAFKGHSKEDLLDETKQIEIFNDVFEQFDDLTTDAANKLVTDTVAKLFPDADKVKQDSFGMTNYFPIVMAIISELKGDTGSTNSYDRIQDLKEKLEKKDES